MTRKMADDGRQLLTGDDGDKPSTNIVETIDDGISPVKRRKVWTHAGTFAPVIRPHTNVGL